MKSLGSSLSIGYAAGLAFDGAGNVLVADVGGSTVLSVDPSTGAATAGFTPVTGVESPAALVALNDVLFVLTPTGIFTASASAGGAASTSAVLPISAMSLGAASNNHSWVSMCVDPQRSFLYYADYTAGALYRSHMSTSGVLTVDSSFHVTGLGNPNSCAVAADGTVVVSDYTGNRMWEVQTGVLTGAAALFSDSLTNSTYPSLSAPGCVALDAAGNLFIAETASGTSGVHLIRSLYI